jgi:hypothetical protein
MIQGRVVHAAWLSPQLCSTGSPAQTQHHLSSSRNLADNIFKQAAVSLCLACSTHQSGKILPCCCAHMVFSVHHVHRLELQLQLAANET